MSSVTKLSPNNRKQFLEDNKHSYIVLAFDADFTDQKDIVSSALETIGKNTFLATKVVLATVDVEENNDYATELAIVCVPMLVCLHNGRPVKKISNLDPVSVVNMIAEDLKRLDSVSGEAQVGAQNQKESFEKYLKSIINRAPIMIFMKGSPEAPRCGFSKQLVELLAKYKTKYETFDILQDDDVRQGLKELVNWPTYPQIYVKGEFIGGLDILKQLDTTGELESTLSV